MLYRQTMDKGLQLKAFLLPRIKAKGLTQEGLAAAIGLSKAAPTGWFSTGKIGRETIGKISVVLGVSVDEIYAVLEGRENVTDASVEHLTPGAQLIDDDNVQRLTPHENGSPPTNRKLYVKGTAQMGADGYWYDLEYPAVGGDGYVNAPTEDPLAYVIRVRGDSMFPAIRDNWLMVVEPSEPLVPGLYVHVKTVDGRYMVKELLWATEGELALHSVNQSYGRLTLRREEVEYAYYCLPLPPNKWRP